MRDINAVLFAHDDGWTEATITVTPDRLPSLSEPQSFTFYYRNIKEVAESIFSSPDLKGCLVLKPEPKMVDIDGRLVRVYDEPFRCDAIVNAYKSVKELAKEKHDEWYGVEDGATVFAMQFYSDKSLLNNKNGTFYPCRFTSLNVPYIIS